MSVDSLARAAQGGGGANVLGSVKERWRGVPHLHSVFLRDVGSGMVGWIGFGLGDLRGVSQL